MDSSYNKLNTILNKTLYNTVPTSTHSMKDILKSRRKTIKNNETQWTKMTKQQKIKRLEQYAEKQNMNKKDIDKLKEYLIRSFQQNRLNKTKDVKISKEGYIISIPRLHIVKTKTNEKRYTLKEN